MWFLKDRLLAPAPEFCFRTSGVRPENKFSGDTYAIDLDHKLKTTVLKCSLRFMLPSRGIHSTAFLDKDAQDWGLEIGDKIVIMRAGQTQSDRQWQRLQVLTPLRGHLLLSANSWRRRDLVPRVAG